MADVIKKTVTVTKTIHEYILRSPTNGVGIEKAVTWAYQDMPEDRRKWDDCLTIISRGDEIVIYWEEEGKDDKTVDQEARTDLIINNDHSSGIKLNLHEC